VNIKPCPFCGKSDISKPLAYHWTGGKLAYKISCLNTKCEASGGYSITEEGAIKAWNNRGCTA